MNARPVYLNGLGILAATGRGPEALLTALQTGWRAPENATLADGRTLPVYPIPAAAMAGKGQARRADRLSKMAVFAASDALQNAQLAPLADRRRIGAIVASAFGPHVTTFQFLDEILTYGDGAVSPTVFSHSVQNAPLAYVTAALDIQGPALTLTQVHFGFHHALAIARDWLQSGRCEQVLVGGMDELGSVMEAIAHALLRPPADGKLRPFAFAREAAAIPGEGSAFFLLSTAPGPECLARLGDVAIGPWQTPTAAPEWHFLEADGSLEDETPYASLAAAASKTGHRLATCSSLFGTLPGGSPLHLAAAALMLHRSPALAPTLVDAASATAEIPSGGVRLTRLRCDGQAGQIQLLSP